jgi:hypothetical protein
MPISGTAAPFACSRNGRKVRKPIRVALSRIPIASSRPNPPRDRSACSQALLSASGTFVRLLDASGIRRSKSPITTAPANPIMPTIDAAERQDITAIRQAVIEGSAILPRSPAKL